jgi:hypothetical protein
MTLLKISRNTFCELAKEQGLDLRNFNSKELHLLVQETLTSLEGLDELELEEVISVPPFSPFPQ